MFDQSIEDWKCCLLCILFYLNGVFGGIVLHQIYTLRDLTENKECKALKDLAKALKDMTKNKDMTNG